jgi:hypothetical protein
MGRYNDPLLNQLANSMAHPSSIRRRRRHSSSSSTQCVEGSN